MKFYDRSGAPNPRRVHIFLHEKGINPEFEIIDLDIFKDEHKNSEFEAKNPMMRVPSLELDDGTIISESVAICRYFEELHPSPPMMGTNALEKAIIEMWNRRIELNFLLPIAMAFRHCHPRMAGLEVPQVAEWGEANKPKVTAMFNILNEQLSKTEFIAGDSFTIADISMIVGMELLKPARIEVPEPAVHVGRWWQTVSARPSYKAGLT